MPVQPYGAEPTTDEPVAQPCSAEATEAYHRRPSAGSAFHSSERIEEVTQVLGDCSAPGQVFIRDRGRAHRNDDRPEYPHASRVVPDRAAPTASVRASVLGTAAVLVSGLRTSGIRSQA